MNSTIARLPKVHEGSWSVRSLAVLLLHWKKSVMVALVLLECAVLNSYALDGTIKPEEHAHNGRWKR